MTTTTTPTIEAPATETEEPRSLPANVTRIGNVTRDPELRYSAKGTACCRFGLAYTPYRPAGEPEAETTFYDVVAFGSLGENVAECITKGDRVIVSGRPEIEEYEAKDGSGTRVAKKIVADSIGAELRFVTVTINKPERRPSTTTQYSDDEEPF